ncbi:MAG: GPR endopeptidase, partial [Erysipelotrichales bacterium]|nr:GPR endopeptidase [Erysipelotrichales bacterium]
FELEGEHEGVSNVSAIAPGVMGQTGIESFDIIEGICKKVSPDYVIIVDALATKTMSRINKMIQISDTGIAPGSGVGNHRKAIDIDTLGVPVLVVGVATVVDIISITKEVIENSLRYENREVDSAYIDQLLDDLSIDTTSSWIVTPREMDHDLIHLSEVIAQAINSSLHPFLRAS